MQGVYYDYDGPCIAKKDTRAQHRILALLIASPQPNDIKFSKKAQLAYQTVLTLSQSAHVAHSEVTPAWQILKAIFNRRGILDPKKAITKNDKYYYSAALFSTVKVDGEASLFKLSNR